MSRATFRTLCLGFGILLIVFAVVWTVGQVVAGEVGNAALGLLGIVFTIAMYRFVRDLTADS